MADDLLLRTSLQRERDEIARLQGQLQQQSIQQQPPPNSPTIGDRRPDLVEQQRRLAMLQQQQQQFQRHMLVHQQQRQQLVGHGTNYDILLPISREVEYQTCPFSLRIRHEARLTADLAKF